MKMVRVLQFSGVALSHFFRKGLLIVHFLGNWGEFVAIPTEKTLKAAETKLQDNTKFLQFVQRALSWDSKARPTAGELLQDPWLSN